jgi:hypothetical protein
VQSRNTTLSNIRSNPSIKLAVAEESSLHRLIADVQTCPHTFKPVGQTNRLQKVKNDRQNIVRPWVKEENPISPDIGQCSKVCPNDFADIGRGLIFATGCHRFEQNIRQYQTISGLPERARSNIYDPARIDQSIDD